MPQPSVQLAVIGGAICSDQHRSLALETGRAIAEAGALLLCGGRGGVMAAAAEGARSAGGRTVGILPGTNFEESPTNPHIEVAIYTGMGQARNQILVLSAAAVIGIGGGWGTLTEIGLARKHRIPVVLLESWHLQRPDGVSEDGLIQANSSRQAVELALAAVDLKGTR
jgi:uncharacterized protein (TIGR00725 family)